MNLFLKFYPGDMVAILTLNVLAQIALVVVLASAVSLLFARHRAAARHAIWLSALGCVLLGPAAAYLAGKSQSPLIPLRLLPQAATSNVEATPVFAIADMPTSPDQLPSPLGSATAGADSWQWPVASDEGPGARDEGAETPNPQISESPTSNPQSPIPNPSAADPWRATFGLSVVLWAAGAIVLLGRLLRGCMRIAWLRRRLLPINGGRLPILTDVRRALGANAKAEAKALPPLRVLPASIELAGPITLGLFRPMVVVPEKLLDVLTPGELRDVLVHEFAHAVRRDPLVGFVQRLAAIVYWPYPPVHFLNRRLAWAREEVCDNYVLRQGDAPNYAETLLSISQTFFSKPPRPIALGLFHPYGRLEQRVAELLDPRRNVMVRTHRALLVLLATAFLAAVVAVAGTRLLQAEPPTPPESAAPAAASKPTAERRTVDKLVKDFPEKDDLSTPESALAAYQRACARADAKGVAALGWCTLSPAELDGLDRFLKNDAKSPDYREILLNAKIIEVLTYRDDLAVVVSMLKVPAGAGQFAVANPISCRTFGRIKGQWKNLGEDRVPSVQAARERFEATNDNRRRYFTEVREDVLAGRDHPINPVRASSDSGDHYVLGAVIERTLVENEKQQLLNLTTGEFFDPAKAMSLVPPPDHSKERETDIAYLKSLTARIGTDLVAKEGYLVGFEMAVFPMPDSETWYGVFPPPLLSILKQAEGATPAIFRGGKDLPATFLFKTRNGTMGVLQIVSVSKGKESGPREIEIKIRYKLLQAKATKKAPASAKPAEAVLNVIRPADVLTIRVVRALPDQPIDGQYPIGPDGTVNLGSAYGLVNVNGLSVEQAERKIAKHLRGIVQKQIDDDIDVRFAAAAADVAKAEYAQAVEANQKVAGTVPQSEMRRRLLELKKMELTLEKARRDAAPAVTITLARKAG